MPRPYRNAFARIAAEDLAAREAALQRQIDETPEWLCFLHSFAYGLTFTAPMLQPAREQHQRELVEEAQACPCCAVARARIEKEVP